jgi:hypothetical protein
VVLGYEMDYLERSGKQPINLGPRLSGLLRAVTARFSRLLDLWKPVHDFLFK